MAGACCFFNIGRVSDVLDVYPLMVIDKENNTFGCPDNFADLVFSLILKQSALLVEAVGFVGRWLTRMGAGLRLIRLV